MLESLLGILLTLFLELLAEVLVALGLGSAEKWWARDPNAVRVLDAIWALLMGAALGVLFSLVLPNRLLPPSRLPGASLVISPLVVGAIMEWFGHWRQRKDREPSVLATFRGGALFGFGFALARLLMIAILANVP